MSMMDVASKQAQQAQTNPSFDTGASQGRVAAQQPKVQMEKPQNLVEDVQNATKFTAITTEEQMKNLVEDLNKAIAPMNTNLKFGVDKDEIFYVSVIESDTSKMIRRFPAEKAQEFLPKINEVTGLLYDVKG